MTQLEPLPGWYPDPGGSGGHRYWDGGNWTPQVRPSAVIGASAAQPAASVRQATSHMLQRWRQLPQKNKLIIIGAVGILMAILSIGTLVHAFTESASYKAGWATGAEWAQGKISTYGAAGIPDAEISGACPGMADFAEHDQMYYYVDGQIAGAKIKHDDFIKGCVRGAQSVKN